MDVVIYEAVGIDFTRTFSRVSTEGIKKSFIVVFTAKDVLLVDTSGDDVIDTGTAFNAGCSGHKELPFDQDYIIVS